MQPNKIFCISLPEREDRRIHIENELTKHGLEFRFWRAIKMDNGVQGLLETMKGLLNHAITIGYENVLICEDDCKFIVDNPKVIIDKCMKQLPPDFDLCYLGVNLWQEEVKLYRKNLIKLTDAYATHCILYSRKGMSKLLFALTENENNTPLDILIKEKIMPDEKCFCSFPFIASQVNSYSDIQNKNQEYAKFLEQRFIEKTKHLTP